MQRASIRRGRWFLLLGWLAGVGCWPASNSQPMGPSPEGKRFLLAEEPADARDLKAVFQELPAPQGPSQSTQPASEPGTASTGEATACVVIGVIPRTIDGLSHWDTRQATFAMIDLASHAAAQQHADQPGHDADNCPFCKRRKAQTPVAVVHVVDADGRTVQQDARRLLGLAEDQVVVVRGKAQRDAIGSVVV